MKRLLFMVLVGVALFPFVSDAGEVDEKAIECVANSGQLKLYAFKNNHVNTYWFAPEGTLGNKLNTATGFVFVKGGLYKAFTTFIRWKTILDQFLTLDRETLKLSGALAKIRVKYLMP